MTLPQETLLRLRQLLVEQRDEMVRAIEADIAAIDTELRGRSSGRTGETPAPPRRTRRGSGPPRGRDAVEVILREAGSGVLVDDGELLDRMVARGIGPQTEGDDRRAQLNAARAAANRLVAKDPDRFERVKGADVLGFRYRGEPRDRDDQLTAMPGVAGEEGGAVT